MSHPAELLRQPVLHAVVNSLGWALLHLIWQGALIAGVLWCTLQILGTERPSLRYLASCSALVLMPISFLATFFRLTTLEYSRMVFEAGPNVHLLLTLSVDAVTSASVWQRIAEVLDRSMVWILVLWVIGVAGFTARLNLGLVAVKLLKSADTFPVSAELQQLLERLKLRLGMDRAIRLVHSARVQVPTVIGWLKPVVLVPLSCFSGMSQAQVEAILCHELAHIRRHDYLVSVLQSCIESLYFYHPAVWWVSRQVRRERECCCDAVAVACGADVLSYARALSILEQQRASLPEIALAANGGVLKMRISRLLNRSTSETGAQANPLALFAATLLLIASIGGYAYADQAKSSASEPQSDTKAAAPAHESSPAIETGVDPMVAAAEEIKGLENGAALQHGNELTPEEQQRIHQAVKKALEKLNSPEFRKQLEESRAAAAKVNSAELQRQLEEARARVSKLNDPEFRKNLEHTLAQMQQINADELHRRLETAQEQLNKLNSDRLNKLQADDRRRAAEIAAIHERLQKQLNSAEFKKQIDQAAAAASKANSAEVQKQIQQALQSLQQMHIEAGHEIARMEAPPAPASAPTDGAAPTGNVRVSAAVMAHQAVVQVPPVYPAEAKAAHIQGTVVLRAIISKTGEVTELRVVSGPKELLTSALDAVKQWKYKPYLLNGQPVEVETTINVNYSLGDPAGASSELDGAAIRHIGGGVTSPELIYRQEADYTPEAKAAKVRGVVIVNLVVDQKGLPQRVHVVRSLDPGLDQKALEAVRQYRFKPAMEAGEPVPAALNVEVNFQVF